MKRYGLIGFPLSHSFSQKYFTEKFEHEEIEDAVYELFPLENIEDIQFIFQIHKDIAGLNVTIPYKESIIEYLDDLDETAKQIGAVNCVKIDEIAKIGYNTDSPGFRDSIKPLLKPHHTKALILGTGGASKAVVYALNDMGIHTQFVSRTKKGKQLTYADIDKSVMDEYTIIINSSPLGMFPTIDVCPQIPYQHISSKHLVYDLVYNPAETLFLHQAKQKGATTKNGLQMLELQADYAWEIWNREED